MIFLTKFVKQTYFLRIIVFLFFFIYPKPNTPFGMSMLYGGNCIHSNVPKIDAHNVLKNELSITIL
jgi:hypothetical protein